MEELTVQPLSPGLGFYEKPKTWNKWPQHTLGPNQWNQHQWGKPQRQTAPFPPIPKELLPDKLNLDNPQTYDLLQAFLSHPPLDQTDPARLDQTGPAHHPVAPAEADLFRSPKRETEAITNTSPIKGTEKPNSLTHHSPPIGNNTTLSKKTNESQTTKKPQTAPQPANTSPLRVLPGLVDVGVVSLFFFPPLVLFMSLIQADPVVMLVSLWPKVVLAFLVWTQMYYLLCRLFCFETFGESLAHSRLVALKSQQKEVPPLRLFWRFVLISVTGFVLFPLLSMAFKKDFLGHLTGTQVVSQKSA